MVTRRRMRLPDAVTAAALAGGIALAYAMAALTPSLLRDHTLLLEALSASVPAIVTGGALARVGELSLLLVVVAPWPTIALYDVAWWVAGRRWGTAVLTSRSKWLVRAEDLVRRRALLALSLAYFLPVPSALVYGLAGASGVSFGLFLLGDLLGLLLWEALLVSLGWGLGQRAVDIVETLDHYALQASVVIIVMVVVVRLGRRRWDDGRGRGTT